MASLAAPYTKTVFVVTVFVCLTCMLTAEVDGDLTPSNKHVQEGSIKEVVNQKACASHQKARGTNKTMQCRL